MSSRSALLLPASYSLLFQPSTIQYSRRHAWFQLRCNFHSLGVVYHPLPRNPLPPFLMVTHAHKPASWPISSYLGNVQYVSTNNGDSKNPPPNPDDPSDANDIESASQSEAPEEAPSSEIPVQKEVLRTSMDVIITSSKNLRRPLDLTVSSMERNFITPGRAVDDFLLKNEHLEGLKATKRRSAFINQTPITVYWRKDVEQKAIEVWGSKDNLLKEILSRQLERKYQEQTTATIKRQLKTSRRERLYGDRDPSGPEYEAKGLLGPSGKVVLSAIAINFCNFVVKAVAWLYTGSHSIFAECVHSLADTMNQAILAFGYHNMRYVSALISGVGIFCVGTGLSFYHGIMGLVAPSPAESFYWAFFSLAGAFLTEGATCLIAVNEIRKNAHKNQVSIREYILTGYDPSVNVVLLEDCAALLSVIVTGSCISLTLLTGSHVPDATGSLLVGGILGSVAAFIIETNVTALVGRSIPQEFLDKINYELESDVMVRGIHDVKGMDLGDNLIRYKAEVDFDGRELTRLYLDHQNIPELFEMVKSMKTIDEFEAFLLTHSESIIDTMGGEIDRIEIKLRKKFPQIRHCDLEIL